MVVDAELILEECYVEGIIDHSGLRSIGPRADIVIEGRIDDGTCYRGSWCNESIILGRCQVGKVEHIITIWCIGNRVTNRRDILPS
jgi:hypothetical protein